MKDELITTATTIKGRKHTAGDCRACRSRDRVAGSAARTRQLIQDIKTKRSWCPHTNTAIFVELDSDGPRGQILDGSTYERCLNQSCRLILRYGV